MATSKTLTPTNVSISIPALSDIPDASVFSNCIDKEADAINTLNSQIANLIKTEKHSSSEISVNAGGVGYTTVDMTKTGYTLIGIVGIDGSGTSGMAYSDWYLADSVNVRVYYKNNSTSDKTGVVLNITGLYVKS